MRGGGFRLLLRHPPLLPPCTLPIRSHVQVLAGQLLKTPSSWSWRSAKNEVQFTPDAENKLQLDLARSALRANKAPTSRFPARPLRPPRPSPTEPRFQHCQVQLNPKSRSRAQPEAIFSRSPSPTGGQKQHQRPTSAQPVPNPAPNQCPTPRQASRQAPSAAPIHVTCAPAQQLPRQT